MTAVPEPSDALIGELATVLTTEHFETTGQSDYYRHCKCGEQFPPLDDAFEFHQARAAYAAMVEHLGLTEETQTRCTGCGSTAPGHMRWMTNHFMHDGEHTEYAHERRLVSRWEQP